jgi:pyruvate dehydrogenase E2 component (dihydrolipoamide acetyltransferase)
MSRSNTEIPHYHVTKRLDLSVMSEQLAAFNEERTVAARVVPGAVLLAAAARAVAAVPACNGWWRDGGFEPATGVAVGVVLSLRTGGLIVPTIEHADTLTVAETMTRLTELVQRARQGRLRASDLAPASVTVTILGDLGADTVAGVIHPPQVALLGLGAVHDELWPVDGGAVVRPTVHADLAGDHRAIDGLSGSRLLTQMQTQLNRIDWEAP